MFKLAQMSSEYTSALKQWKIQIFLLGMVPETPTYETQTILIVFPITSKSYLALFL